MPAHIKSALVGASVTIPIKDGKLVSGILHTAERETTNRHRLRELGKESGILSSVRLGTSDVSLQLSRERRLEVNTY